MIKVHDELPRCGCPVSENYADRTFTVDHRENCLYLLRERVRARARAAATPLAGSIGGGQPVASMDLARFKRAEKPAEINPRAALEAAMEWIDDPETPKPTHIIVLVGRDAPDHAGASATRYFQAGAYRHHGQMGLCLEAMHMIRESGSGD